jgi:hypothetical protein
MDLNGWKLMRAATETPLPNVATLKDARDSAGP